MQVLVRAYSTSEYPHASAAVVEFDPNHILGLMDNWPECDPAEMCFYDYAEWYDPDPDAIDVLDNDPIVEFSQVPLGSEMSVECERMVVDKDRVHWTGSVKHTTEQLETMALSREFLSQFKDAVQRLKEAIDDQG